MNIIKPLLQTGGLFLSSMLSITLLSTCTLRTVSPNEGVTTIETEDWPMVKTMNGRDFPFSSYYEGYNEPTYNIQDGSYGTLVSNHSVNLGGNDYTLTKTVYFYKNGHVSLADLARDHQVTIKGLNLSLAKGDAHFHENGMLNHVVLLSNQDVVLNGVTYSLKGGTRIFFHMNGQIKSTYITNEITLTLAGVTYVIEDVVDFYATGEIERSRLVHDLVYTNAYGQLTLWEDHIVKWHPSGELLSGIPKEAFTFSRAGQVFDFLLHSEVSFHTNGWVHHGAFGSTQTIVQQGISYVLDVGMLTSMLDDGTVIQGRLGADMVIDGTTYVDETWLRFDSQGHFVDAGSERQEGWTGVP